MPCQLTPCGTNWCAATSVTVKVKVVADNTTITAATYNDGALTPADDNSVSFKVVRGAKLLNLALMGPDELVQVVEVCTNGTSSQVLDEFDKFRPTEGLIIRGQP